MSEDVQFVKPKDSKHKRRSSFFRRSIGRPSICSDSPTGYNARGTLMPQESDESHLRESKRIEYLNKLKKEREDWEKLYKQKTKEEEELIEKGPKAVSSVDLLSAQDMRKLLEDRPDYLAIGRLLDSVTEAVAIKQRRINSTMEKVDIFLAECEQESDQLAEDIIDYFTNTFDEFEDSGFESTN